jgi:hypothetical protein
MKKYIKQFDLAAAFVLGSACPVLAQSSIDPSSSLQSILTWGLTIAGIVIAVICMFKGIQAVADGRHIGNILVGLLVGTVICFGGAAIVHHFGA